MTATAMLAMDDAGPILTSYVVVLGGIVGYAVWMLRRARRLSDAVPDEDKTWT